MNVLVHLKCIGKKKNSIQELPFYLEKCPSTVQELIVETVRTCVRDYNDRRQEQELLKNLTSTQIENMASSGKVSFGVNYGEKDADFTEAVENAIQSYEDGIFRIFIDEDEAGKTNDVIQITEKTNLTFVRLTMLAGRMW